MCVISPHSIMLTLTFHLIHPHYPLIVTFSLCALQACGDTCISSHGAGQVCLVFIEWFISIVFVQLYISSVHSMISKTGRYLEARTSLQSDPDLPGPDIPEPRLTGRINFPLYFKYNDFPIYRAPIYRAKTLSPDHPGESGSDCSHRSVKFVVKRKVVGTRGIVHSIHNVRQNEPKQSKGKPKLK
eukprot:sb/3471392/